MATLGLRHFLGWQGQGQITSSGEITRVYLKRHRQFKGIMPSYKLFGHNKKKKKNKKVLIASMSDPS
jgi:hypothetical protein